MSCPDRASIKFGLITSFSVVLTGLITFGVGHFAQQLSTSEQQELDDLDSAWDSTCNFSSRPGTPRIERVSYSSTHDKHNSVHKTPTVVECRATVNYMGDTSNPAGTAEVLVLAGYDFKSQQNATMSERWCADALSGTWQNIKLGRSKSSGWECGDLGWVGCEKVKTTERICNKVCFNTSGSSCEHNYGPVPKRGGMYANVKDLSPGRACPVARDGEIITCSIDSLGQLRFGTVEESIQQTLEDINKARTWLPLIRMIGLCVIGVGCFALLCCTCLAVVTCLMPFYTLQQFHSAHDGPMPQTIGTPQTGMCINCYGTGETGLLGPRGLGLFTKACSSCNGTGYTLEIYRVNIVLGHL